MTTSGFHLGMSPGTDSRSPGAQMRIRSWFPPPRPHCCNEKMSPDAYGVSRTSFSTTSSYALPWQHPAGAASAQGTGRGPCFPFPSARSPQQHTQPSQKKWEPRQGMQSLSSTNLWSCFTPCGLSLWAARRTLMSYCHGWFSRDCWDPALSSPLYQSHEWEGPNTRGAEAWTVRLVPQPYLKTKPGLGSPTPD